MYKTTEYLKGRYQILKKTLSKTVIVKLKYV